MHLCNALSSQPYETNHTNVITVILKLKYITMPTALPAWLLMIYNIMDVYHRSSSIIELTFEANIPSKIAYFIEDSFQIFLAMKLGNNFFSRRTLDL